MKKENIGTELKDVKRNRVPIQVSGIGTRISAASDLIGTRKSAADAAGISSDTLQRYIREDVQPSIGPVVALANAAKISLEWLSTGRGSMRLESQSPVAENDLEILESLIEAVEDKLQNARAIITPAKKAVLIRLLYEEKLEGQGKSVSDSFVKYLKLVS